MTRKHSPTSKAGEEFIKPHKPSHIERILEALAAIKIGGTQEEIAVVAGMRPDQVWKRLSEAERSGRIFNAGITRKLKSGVPGIVWQLTGKEAVDVSNPKTTSQQKAVKSINQLSLL